MANARIRATDAAWSNGTSILPAELKALDEQTSSGVMYGDSGGTFTSQADFEIAGAGLRIVSESRLGGAGGFIGHVKTVAASGKRITHEDSDYVTLGASHDAFVSYIRTHATEGVDVSDGSAAYLRRELDDTASAYGSGTVVRTGGRILVPLHALAGSRLTAVYFYIAVGTAHANAPATLPQFRVKRVDDEGNELSLASTATYPDGWRPFSPTPASGVAWYAAGAMQTFAFATANDTTCDVDLSQYTYWAEMMDESGTDAQANTRLIQVRCYYTRMTDLRPQ